MIELLPPSPIPHTSHHVQSVGLKLATQRAIIVMAMYCKIHGVDATRRMNNASGVLTDGPENSNRDESSPSSPSYVLKHLRSKRVLSAQEPWREVRP